MLQRLFLLAAVVLLTACSKGSAEEQAMAAAGGCYASLLEGDYAAFLAGRAGMDNIPDSYREQLLVAYKQFMHRQREVHSGIESFTPLRARMDSSLHVMQVYLAVNYSDSTTEEIVVPMVEYNGKWLMK